jgi:protein-S-isoprenylcysteine O-methyltransferase Ste14
VFGVLDKTVASLELKIPPLLLTALFGGAMYGTAMATPTLSITLPGAGYLAIALGLAGCLVAGAAVVEFRRHGTTVNPLSPGQSDSIVRTGVYALSRNPMYLGFLLWLGGLSALLSNPATLGGLPAFVLYMNRFQIVPEERVLLANFGEQFEHYMATVRRWV